MAPRRCIFGCEGKRFLFSFPKDEITRRKWTELIFTGQQKQYTYVFVCHRHFEWESFFNMGRYEAGLATKLQLKDGALPTRLVRIEECEAEPSTSTPLPTNSQHTGFKTEPGCDAHFSPSLVSVGTNTTVSFTKSVATQLSYNTLRSHVKSRGTATSLSSHHVGTQTIKLKDHRHQFSSRQVRGFASGVRPLKRSCLEFEAEETTVPLDSTYESDESMTEPSDMTEMESTDYSDTKYIVYESCLKELFEKCPECKHECQVQSRRIRKYVAFIQLCPNCQYYRKWHSQPLKEGTEGI